tara:strand:- start:118 stop:579 length:462 start_codon:yes stop_codon:yes gene_type:complete
MSFIEWHKKYTEKSFKLFRLTNYQGLWVSFIKGLIFGAIIMWFISCEGEVKKQPSAEVYTIGVKGNCGMCKTSIEKAVKNLDFVIDAEWGIETKILDVTYNDSSIFDFDALNNAINESGYETMNSTANQSSYDALPMCCKYDRNMQVYFKKPE